MAVELIPEGKKLHKIYRCASDRFLGDQAMAEYQRWSDDIRQRDRWLKMRSSLRSAGAALAIGVLLWVLASKWLIIPVLSRLIGVHFHGPSLS